jgi:hypothetical protein
MALYGQMRDISMFRFVNRELMHKIISEQVVFYKYNITTTKVNMYGEASEGRNFADPVLLFSLIEVNDQTSPVDLVDANLHPEVGDIIMWQNGYWEVDNVNATQFFVGKDPDYPYLDGAGNNPYETDLGQFGYNVSIICDAHYTPSDKVNIELSRL